MTLEHLRDAQLNLKSFIENEERQNSMTVAICKGLVTGIETQRQVLKTAIETVSHANT